MDRLRCLALVSLWVAFGASPERVHAGAVAIPETPKLFLGTCGPGPNAASCAWDCDAETATCGSGAPCALDVADVFTAHLVVRATDCTVGGGAQMEFSLTGTKRDGTPLPVIRQSLDFCTARVACGNCTCPQGGFGQCPPVPGFFCTFDGNPFTEAAFVDPGTGIERWMVNQVLPESVRAALAPEFPGANGPALVVQNLLQSPPVDHSGDALPSEASMCITVWLLRGNRSLPLPADVAATVGASSTFAPTPGSCPGVCGNHSLDPGEQCDLDHDAACPGQCGAPGSATACQCPGQGAPRCQDATPSPARLWPANGKLVPVAIDGIVDPDGDPVTVTIGGVRQDEMSDDPGRRNLGADAVIPGEGTVLLRAERARGGDGRVYHVSFTASDGNGHQCTGATTVCVPRNHQASCGDQGALFDSTAAP